MRAGYKHVTRLGDVSRHAAGLPARTMIFDVEPLAAYWDSGTDALDQGIARVFGEVAGIPGLQVVCFATNSPRRPSALPDGAGMRVIYLAAAGKPLRTAPYRRFPRPGMVIGDQVVTDGILARRLGYAFVLYDPPLVAPLGPRVLSVCGRIVRPLFFRGAD